MLSPGDLVCLRLAALEIFISMQLGATDFRRKGMAFRRFDGCAVGKRLLFFLMMSLERKSLGLSQPSF